MFITIHQKKALAYTTIITLLIVFLLFFVGLKYMDPPEEYGVAINFGYTDYGSGVKANQTIKTAPKVTETSPPKEVKPQATPKTIQEKVITQENVEAPVIESTKQTEKITEQEVKEIKTVVEKKAVVKEVPKPSKDAQNALNNLFGPKKDGASTNGEGDDRKKGLKGKTTGDPLSNKYYGSSGSGGDGNYLLKGRKALSKPINKPDCNEEGIVVVKIEVDKNGKVILAEAGVKGTTNYAACLLEPAKKAALNTKWNSDGNAPFKQIGFITYNFVLAE